MLFSDTNDTQLDTPLETIYRKLCPKHDILARLWRACIILHESNLRKSFYINHKYIRSNTKTLTNPERNWAETWYARWLRSCIIESKISFGGSCFGSDGLEILIFCKLQSSNIMSTGYAVTSYIEIFRRHSMHIRQFQVLYTWHVQKKIFKIIVLILCSFFHFFFIKRFYDCRIAFLKSNISRNLYIYIYTSYIYIYIYIEYD